MVKILGVKIDNVSLKQALQKVEVLLRSKKPNIFTIVTPNPEIIVQAQDDPQLRKILNEADLGVPDGIGIIWASQINPMLKAQRSSIKETVPGVKLMQELCRLAAERGWTVGLYGGRGGVARQTLAHLQKKYKGLRGWSRESGEIDISQLDNHVDRELRKNGQDSFGEKSHLTNHVDGRVRQDVEDKQREGVREEKGIVGNEMSWVASKIAKTKTRLLFVGLGAPKQEFFMEKLLLKVQSQTKTFGSVRDRGSRVKERKKEKNKKLASSLVLMGVGGAFDEIAGRVRPAPELVSRAGFKWLWRLFWQPWRLKRQLRLVKFVYLVIGKRYL